MTGLNESEIKAALQAARTLSDRSRVAEPAASGQPVPPDLQRRRDALLGTALANAKFDTNRFGELLDTSGVEAAQFADARRSAAARRPAAAKEAMNRIVDGRRLALEHLKALGSVQYFALDSPFLIWPTRGIILESSSIEPWNSQAKFTLQAGNSGGSELRGHEELAFYYLWENPRETFSVVTVDGFLILDGFCDAIGHGGIFPGTRYSRLQVDATMRLLEWWNQPPTEPPPEPDQSQRAVTIDVDTGGFGDFTHVEVVDVFRGYDLRYTFFAMPPQAVVVIEMAVAVSYDLEDGSVDMQFATGDFNASSPFVQVALLP